MTSESQPVQFIRLTSDQESVARIKKLNSLFANAFGEKSTYLGNRPSDHYLISLLSKEHIIVCVAVIDQEVVAGLVAYVMDKFEKERSEVYIYDLAVDIKHRRKKIVTDLIFFLKKEALRTGAWVVFVQADPEDKPAIKLYDSLGKREEVFHFDIELGE